MKLNKKVKEFCDCGCTNTKHKYIDDEGHCIHTPDKSEVEE